LCIDDLFDSRRGSAGDVEHPVGACLIQRAADEPIDVACALEKRK
jgi:hypothetical protein